MGPGVEAATVWSQRFRLWNPQLLRLLRVRALEFNSLLLGTLFNLCDSVFEAVSVPLVKVSVVTKGICRRTLSRE